MLLYGVTSNKGMDVTDDNHAKVASRTSTKDNFINGDTGRVWSLPFKAIDPAGADDKFFYITNTGSEPIRIIDIRASSTVVGIISVHKVSGTPTYVGATTVSPVTHHAGKNPLLSATVNTDTDITGLTDEGVWHYIPLDVVGKGVNADGVVDIILDQGAAMTLEWDTSTGVLTGSVTVVENGLT